MKVLIAGLGSVGQRHLRNLRTLGIDDLILCRSGKATLIQPDLERYPVVRGIEEGLACGPQAVVIATPTHLHMEAALEAARQGCAIFLEKPISHNCDGLDELVRSIEARGLVTQLGFQFRFHPAFEKAGELIAGGRIGNIHSAHALWGEYLPAWHPWEDYRAGYAARAEMGGGVMRTLCHPLDYLCGFAGVVAEVKSLHSSLNPLGIDVEQAAVIALRFESGAIGSIYLDYLRRPKAHRFEIVGSQAVLHWDEGTNRLTLQSEGRADETWSFAGFERNHMFLAEMNDFVEGVRAGRPTRSPIPAGAPLQRWLCAGASP